MNIALTPEIEKALSEEAQKQGTTPETLALDCLRERFVGVAEAEAPAGPEGTLADFLADFIGVIASGSVIPGGAHMSEDPGDAFAKGMAEKREQGRL